jgi:hypothetical protein
MQVEPPRAIKGRTCPFLKKDMSTVCHKCPLWIKVVGKDPQSDATIDQWNCAFAFLPVLLVENSQMQRQTGAAVESARNDHAYAMRDLSGVVGNALREIASRPPGRLLDGAP